MLRQSAFDLTPPLPNRLPLVISDRADSAVRYRALGTAATWSWDRIRDLGSLGAGPVWQLEPYRGSELDLPDGSPRMRSTRRTVRAGEGLVCALRRELRRGHRPRLWIAIGDRFDAYPSVERQFGVTRSLLEALTDSAGLEIRLTTRSPLVLRDQDLLGRLDRAHSVTVRVPISSLDPRFAARIEPGAADATARLEIVRRLARDGIATIVSCGPILPGLNNSADELDPLFAAARRAGAIDVIANTRLLAPSKRPRVVAWLRRNFPDRADTVARRLTAGDPGSHLGTLERLRLTYGFPVLRAGRG